ncbi:hypothetical protein Hdeb2414_s0008g00276891 [Helianthus debilis subsp. tardiflorus]
MLLITLLLILKITLLLMLPLTTFLEIHSLALCSSTSITYHQVSGVIWMMKTRHYLHVWAHLLTKVDIRTFMIQSRAQPLFNQATHVT